MNWLLIRTRIYGVLFLVVGIGLIGLSVAVYQKRFTPIAKVVLTTDSTGNELMPQSDVKLKGIEVGEVRSIRSTGNGAQITMAIDPSKLKLIPSNTTAELLPKTLFGERYVALVLPDSPAGELHAGDTIHQDTSYKAAQLQDLLRNIQPVLDALDPAELNATLTAVATALQGRGNEIGQSLVQLDSYLKQLNPSAPQLATDLVNLGKVASTYDAAMPNIIDTLNNLKTTSNTVTTKKSQIVSFLSSGITATNNLNGFLNADGNDIIQIAATAQPVLNTLATYAPEYTCLFAGVVKLDQRAEQAVSGGSLHATVINTKWQGRYLPNETPKTVSSGANCNGLPNPTVPSPGGVLADGASQVGGAGSGALSGGPTSDGSYVTASDGENALINTLVASSYHNDPAAVPAIATILAQPIFRGERVVVSGS